MDARSGIHRALGMAAVFFSLIAGLFGLQGVGYWALRSRGPDADEHRAASARLRAERAGRDEPIFLLPDYATEARTWLGDLDTRAVRHPELEDLEPYDAIWLYALDDAAAPSVDRLQRAGHTATSIQMGDVELVRVELSGPRARVRWSATASIARARVEHEHPGRANEACRRWQAEPGGGRWVCPHDGDWFYVGAEWHRMGERPRWCLWAHPPSEGRVWVHFEGVPRGTSLVGHGGHTLNSSRHAHAEVNLDVRIDEGPEQRFVFELEDTWRPYRMKVPVATSSRGADRMDLSFAISSPHNGANHFCFEADVRELRP